MNEPFSGPKEGCNHDWHIWPETDGQGQRCLRCGSYRATQKENSETTVDALLEELDMSWSEVANVSLVLKTLVDRGLIAATVEAPSIGEARPTKIDEAWFTKALLKIDAYARSREGWAADEMIDHLRTANVAAAPKTEPHTGLVDMPQDMGGGKAWFIELATEGELAAYDEGCDGMMRALGRILDGKDDGTGISRDPWETLRRRVLALMKGTK